MDEYIAIYCYNAEEFNKIQDFFIDKGYVWINGLNMNFRESYHNIQVFLYNDKEKTIATYYGEIEKYPYHGGNYIIEKQIDYKKFMRKLKFEKINGK